MTINTVTYHHCITRFHTFGVVQGEHQARRLPDLGTFLGSSWIQGSAAEIFLIETSIH